MTPSAYSLASPFMCLGLAHQPLSVQLRPPSVTRNLATQALRGSLPAVLHVLLDPEGSPASVSSVLGWISGNAGGPLLLLTFARSPSPAHKWSAAPGVLRDAAPLRAQRGFSGLVLGTAFCRLECCYTDYLRSACWIVIHSQSCVQPCDICCPPPPPPRLEGVPLFAYCCKWMMGDGCGALGGSPPPQNAFGGVQ